MLFRSGYGHPDHIQAHRVAMRAAERASGAGWHIPKIYWNTIPRSVIEEGIEAMKGTGTQFFGVEKAEDFPFAAADELVTSVIDAEEFAALKMDAMRAHPTQISVDGPFFALSDNLGFKVWGREFYRLVRGEKSGPFDSNGRETDLFAGLQRISSESMKSIYALLFGIVIGLSGTLLHNSYQPLGLIVSFIAI